MTRDTPMQGLLMELVTAANGGEDGPAFEAYARRRLDEELESQTEAYDLIIRLAVYGALVTREWSEDTDRPPEEVLRTIALSMYTDDEG